MLLHLYARAFIQITLAQNVRETLAPDAVSTRSRLLSFSSFVRALVTNNRVVRCIFYNYTRVDAGASLYAPLEPVIITYHLFLPTSAGIGVRLLHTQPPEGESSILEQEEEEQPPPVTTEPPDNKYAAANPLATMKLSLLSRSISLPSSSSLTMEPRSRGSTTAATTG